MIVSLNEMAIPRITFKNDNSLLSVDFWIKMIESFKPYVRMLKDSENTDIVVLPYHNPFYVDPQLFNSCEEVLFIEGLIEKLNKKISLIPEAVSIYGQARITFVTNDDLDSLKDYCLNFINRLNNLTENVMDYCQSPLFFNRICEEVSFKYNINIEDVEKKINIDNRTIASVFGDKWSQCVFNNKTGELQQIYLDLYLSSLAEDVAFDNVSYQSISARAPYGFFKLNDLYHLEVTHAQRVAIVKN